MNTFVLTEEHIKLLRAAYIGWDTTEFGAPCIDPKRPFGNSSVVRQIHQILGWPIPSGDSARECYFDEEGSTRAAGIYRELETALQIVLQLGTFEPGVFDQPNYMQWKRREEPATNETIVDRLFQLAKVAGPMVFNSTSEIIGVGLVTDSIGRAAAERYATWIKTSLTF